MSSQGKKQAQSEKTRAALVSAARALFAEKGFAATGTEEVVARAGVSRGALYHQFRDKSDLFLAVFEDVERDLVERVTEAVAGETDPAQMMRAGCEAFLDICCEDDIRQISMLDAPSVVGWQRWREIDARYGLGLIRGMVGMAAERGALDPSLVDEVSHLFLAALGEAAMMVAHAPGDASVRERVGRGLGWMIDKLLLGR